MARSLVFCDSFDHYNSIPQKYAGAGAGSGIDLSGSLSRTGIGCCTLSGPTGPLLTLNPISGPLTAFMATTAYYQPGTEDSTSAGLLTFFDFDPGPGADITALFGIGVNSSLALVCSDTTGVVATSAAGIITPNAYNVISVKCFFVAAAGGSAIVFLNGTQVAWISGGLTGLTTLVPARSATGGECNGIQLGGPGGAAGARHDDFQVYTSTATDASDFLGANTRVYAMVPLANGSPTGWTPLSGANFANVNEVPPDGDTTYVSSQNVGDIDQYEYFPPSPIGTPPTGIPPGLMVIGAQHLLFSKVATGAASIASDVDGHIATGAGIGSSYHYVPITQYDTNPATGGPWNLTDFPGTTLGPDHSL